MLLIAYSGLSLIAISAFAQHTDSIRTKQERTIEIVGKLINAGRMPIKLVQAQSVAEGLLLHPGLQLRDYGGFGGIKTVSFRGLGAEHTQILLNGFQIGGNAIGMTDLSTLPALAAPELRTLMTLEADHSVSELNAGGVLSINAGLKSDTTLLELNGGSMGFFSSGLNLRRAINSGRYAGHSILSIKSEQASGSFDYTIKNSEFATTASRSNAGFKNHSLFSYSTLHAKKASIKGQLLLNHSDRQLPGAIILYNPFSEQNLFNTRLTAGVSLNQELDKSWSFSAKAAYQLDNTRYQDPLFLNNAGGIDSRYFWHEGSVKTALGYSHDRFSARLLADISTQRMEYGALNSDGLRPRRNIISPGLDLSYKLWTNVELRIANSVWMVQENQSSLVTTRPANTVQISWQVKHEGIAIEAKPYVRQFMRLPTMAELYYGQSLSRNLQPELVDMAGFNINIKSEVQSLNTTFNFDLNGYWQRHQNKIVAIPTRNLFIWSIVNVGLAEGLGFEAQANGVTKLSPSTQIGIDASLTLQQLRDVTNSELPSYGGQLPYLPALSAAGQVSLMYHGLGIFWQSFYNGQRYTLAENTVSNQLPSFSTHDIKLSYGLRSSRPWLNRMQLQASVRNLFDEQYQVILSFPMPGRYYMAGISYAL